MYAWVERIHFSITLTLVVTLTLVGTLTLVETLTLVGILTLVGTLTLTLARNHAGRVNNVRIGLA